MKIFFDTEFQEDGKIIELISIGLVREDGKELYLESSEYDITKATPWLKENVIPSLAHKNITTKRNIAKEVIEFVGKSPEFWAYYADYDWVLLCQLYGTMMDLPDTWPMYCRDIKQLCDDKGNPELPPQILEHNALKDARWNFECYRFLKELL